MTQSDFFNPESVAKQIMLKSFLPNRETHRQSGSQFFKDNKIRTCSFVKETAGGYKAVGHYEKRNTTMYPTKSTVYRSSSSAVHDNKGTLHAGMGSHKPLHVYNPNDQRNLTHIQDFRPPYPNSSKIEIGKRRERDCKHYQTTYTNSFIHENKNVQTSNPAIQAFKNKWLRSRLAR